MPTSRPVYIKRQRTKKRTNPTKISGKSLMTYNQAKRTPIMRISRECLNGVYNFVRFEANFDQLTSSAVSWVGGAKAFHLSDVAGFTEFTQLFDSYQIAKVKITFEPDVQMSVSNIGDTNPANQVVPSLYICRDLDNTVAPASEQVLAERSDVIRIPATKSHHMSIVPQVGREIYRSTTNTAYETPYKVIWLDNAYSDVPHYGLIYGITADIGGASSLRYKYTIRCQYWVRFRAIR